MISGDLSGASMLDLFRIETESQTQVLTSGLLVLERNPIAAEQLELCMRAAHSLKGAARIVDRPAAVTIAHAMEDCLVAAQEHRITLTPSHVDRLLRGVDWLTRIAQLSDDEAAAWHEVNEAEIAAFAASLSDRPAPAPTSSDEFAVADATPLSESSSASVTTPELEPATRGEPTDADRVLRVTADHLDRLLGLSSEALVGSRWLKPFAQSLRLKRLQHELGRDLDRMRESLAQAPGAAEAALAHADAQRRLQECSTQLNQWLEELEVFDRRSSSLSHRLYTEAVALRMRPFADGVHGLARMVRDVSRSLDKAARLEVRGEATEVDRDILEKLEAPLSHLLRNAIDHGIETPAERVAAGKPEEGVITLEARHAAGRLQITITDDGRGIDLDQVRAKIVERKLTTADTAERLTEAELLEFLFLPGFSLRNRVTEISGRGVGLDVVQTTMKSLRGTVRASLPPAGGVTFQLLLPLTLSVLRALLVEIGGEPYAFPLAAVARTVRVPLAQIGSLEGRQHFEFAGRQISLVAAHQLLGLPAPRATPAEWPIVVLGAGSGAYGLGVDRFLGERELVVQPLDTRLGKLPDVAAGALMEDGAPVLILDVEDMVRSAEKLLAAGPRGNVTTRAAAAQAGPRKRVLIVDDSLTVRELERKLLGARGYAVEVAVDGMDAWNAVRSRAFDLVVTDIDMPRMDGFELVRLIKRDSKLSRLPVMIVSYKDREEDRQRGLDAGADYYLTKGSFHDETLLQAVVDLIGEAQA